MVEQEEKQILPHTRVSRNCELRRQTRKKEMKTRACITAETKRDLIELLQEFKDVFVWSYQDIWSKSNLTLVLQVVKYSEWVANIVPVPKKNGKGSKQASPKDNFPLPHINILVDNKTGYSLFSFMGCFSETTRLRCILKIWKRPYS
ncbi:RNA-directed DNA polymerase (Reverse transcriptase), Ribonuclease H [Gossypium australe]|uniref:RNA-directed DNA polymerase (Reverse transcriptase), Ribonuclease H n=1 Tax=Gossypium australe TaxID=47621 RepID=A0A5B6UUS4_9ROSI|nr:RNA-directed DNA polymerase (Reverse transcriptase), Ribonuclease H [Gossypium australe]